MDSDETDLPDENLPFKERVDKTIRTWFCRWSLATAISIDVKRASRFTIVAQFLLTRQSSELQDFIKLLEGPWTTKGLRHLRDAIADVYTPEGVEIKKFLGQKLRINDENSLVPCDA